MKWAKTIIVAISLIAACIMAFIWMSAAYGLSELFSLNYPRLCIGVLFITWSVKYFMMFYKSGIETIIKGKQS